jgi:ABC-type sugar transport system permease subunit
MSWLGFFLTLWGLIIALLSAFVVVDARNAYDKDPETPTLSEYIKRWRRKNAYRAGLLATTIATLLVIPVYLFVHLVLEVV